LSHRSRCVCFSLLVLGILATLPAFSQCPADSASSAAGNFNDYGLLFRGARDPDPGCAQRAATKLYDKLGNEPSSAWTGFLSGATVTYVMATAMEASGRGNLFGDLDARVRDVANTYQLGFATGDPCGFANGRWTAGNNCMDDYSIAASGWAWVAAFQRVTARDWTSSRAAAIYYMQQSFNPYDAVCMNMPGRALDASSGPCNASPSELGAGGARIVSINHGNQTPAYGLGLMTSIAAAFVALDVIQAPVNTYSELNADHHAVIDNLFVEGQVSTDTAGNFLSAGCRKPDGASSTGWDENWPCWDDIGWHGLGYTDANGSTPYRAKFYPIKNFYTTYGFGTGSGSLYQFDQFDDTFDPVTNFFGPGRKETYQTLANTWIQAGNRPPLTGNSEYKMNMIVAYTGWRMTAVGGGGGNVNADTFNTGNFETFWIYDMNGAQFNSGDPVTAKAFNGQYLRADLGGGGSLDAAGSFSDPNSQFVIIKTGGSSGSLIAGGDTFALRAPDGWHYVTAVNGGGGVVMANATGIGNDQTFMFNRPTTY
jgi:hypothetical protein